MSEDDYTPTTEDVRYVYCCDDHDGTAGLGAEFDRWLKSVRAQAWDEGNRNGRQLANRHKNPYKEEATND